MLNAPGPRPDELPSSTQLLRSTLIAIVVATCILVFVVLPAEYAIDPTGVGGALGLTRMGEIKTQLAEEAAAEEVSEAAEAPSSSPVVAALPAVDDSPATTPAWRHETKITIAPDEAVELKLVMTEGSRAEFEWTADGGTLNYNAHGDGNGLSVEYGKGRFAAGDAGELVAPFDGYHGCFWRNRSGNPVELTYRTRGEYSEIKRTR